MLQQLKVLALEGLVFVTNRLLANFQKLAQLPSLRMRRANGLDHIPISLRRSIVWKSLSEHREIDQPSLLVLIHRTTDTNGIELEISLKALVETKYKNLTIAFYNSDTPASDLSLLPLFRLDLESSLRPFEKSNDRCFDYVSRIYPGDFFTKDALHLALAQKNYSQDNKEKIIFGNRVSRNPDSTATLNALPNYGKVTQLYSHFIDRGFFMSWSLATKYSKGLGLSLDECLDLCLLEGMIENSDFDATHVNHSIFVIRNSLSKMSALSPTFLSAIRNRLDKNLEVETSGEGNLKIDLAPGYFPKVQIIIPTRDGLELLRACVESVQNVSSYKNYAITIVDNGSVMAETLAYFEVVRKLGVEVIRADVPFNFSYLNNLIGLKSESEYICLLNNDIQVSSPNWLESMIALSILEKDGIIGTKLLYPDGRIQHLGVQIKQNGSAGHPYHGLKQSDPRIPDFASASGEVDAITAACMLVPTKIYKKLGGLDEEFRVGLNDIDFCLRARDLGVKCIQNNDVFLFHHESASRGSGISIKTFLGYAREVALFNFRHRKEFKLTRPGLTLLNPGGEVDLPRHLSLSGALK